MQNKWMVLRCFKDGHKFFANEAGDVAVADQSGFFPEETDDGVLWLDVGDYVDLEAGVFTVEDQTQRKWNVPASTEELVWIALYTGRPLRVGAALYRLKEDGNDTERNR